MLHDIERILPHVRKRIEAATDLDKLTLAERVCELAPRDVSIRRLRRGDISVAHPSNVNRGLHGRLLGMCTNTLNVIYK